MNLNRIQNSYLRLLLQDNKIEDLLTSVNIEDIEDHTTKVICRTIAGSIEALTAHLDVNDEHQVSNSI